jgi:predicted transcriptional regulator
MVNTVIKARDVMRTQFVEIEGVATVADAINAFKDNEIEVLVVKKRDEHDAYGVVLLSDIVKKVLAKNRAVNRVNIYEIMSKPIISIEPEMNIRYCARLFDNFGLSHTVVVEGGKVLGIVGYKEILVPWFEMDN